MRLVEGEAWLEGVHIAPYLEGSYYNHDPTRPRRLLLHKSELRQLEHQTGGPGLHHYPAALVLQAGPGQGRARRRFAASGSTRSARRWRRGKPSARWIGPCARTGGDKGCIRCSGWRMGPLTSEAGQVQW